jgi:thiol-disulfide isomerase/thioredoxin
MRLLSALLVAGVAGCATADRVQQLEEKVTALEGKVAELEKAPARGNAAAAAAANPEEEKAAGALYEELSKAVDAGNLADAKVKVEELRTKYPNTTAAKRARKMGDELAVVGNAAPASLEVEKWYQGKTDFKDGKATLLVFWESWCPHCRKHVPEVEKTYAELGSKGLNVVALTKVTRSSTDEKVTEFIGEHKLTFPMAKETGAMSEAFAVSGIPAAAVVKDGKIVWRGHPAKLSDDILKSFL